MGFNITYQQKCIYKHCPNCHQLLILHTPEQHFKIGHNMNYCYNCGFDLRKDKDTINVSGSWDLYSVCINGEEMIYNETLNVIYTDIPDEAKNKLEKIGLTERMVNNIPKEKWNYNC